MKYSFVFLILIATTNCIAQNVGIGTITPKAKLHVLKGAALVDPYFGSTLAVQSDGETMLHILSGSNTDQGSIMFGNIPQSISAGIQFNTFTSNDLSFFTNASLATLIINNLGNVGMHTVTPKAAFNVAAGKTVLFGADTTSGTAGGKMIWYSSKSAFRAGYSYLDAWDFGNVGYNSLASGFGTKASGASSTAMGAGCIASGFATTAMGNATIASNDAATAMGNATTASGFATTAMGSATVASGSNSTAMGSVDTASGSNSTAMGFGTLASGQYSVALGYSTTASGISSISMGNGTTASGPSSTTMGAGTIASGHATTAMGNGTIASLDCATAMGNATKASGFATTALGSATVASGSTSTAMGGSTTASGGNSTAMGESTTASGGNSTAIGYSTIASGNISMATGNFTTAKSFDETSFGAYNTDYTPASSTDWNANDRLFVVGNGTAPGTRSDAMVILKNGNTGIGPAIPAYKLDVTGDINASGFVRSNGIALTSDARFKQNIRTLPNALHSLLQLRGTNYFFNTQAFPGKNFSSDKQMGVIAQEVEKVFPELVATDKDGYKSVNYIGLIPVMIESIKEQQTQIEKQNYQIEKLTRLVNQLLNK